MKIRLMKKILTLFATLSLTVCLSASVPDEGMWIPMLIEKYNIKLMQEKGFKLSAEDIYSVNKASMKDAVVLFGRGCTGELISPEGLLITNHHCGFSQIQSHSTLENDYITNGFWAGSREEELPNPGLTVTILKRMEDVSAEVLTGVKDGMDQEERTRIINGNINRVVARSVAGTEYSAVVKPFYMGNQYFLFVNETFRDVRLVGAPPSSIGNFGGDTDNWVWPRHTGDFSIFRVYADKNNRPAAYSEDNIPYKPLYHFPISLKGIKENDFTMVFGYPGTTYQYVPSYYIDMVKNHINPKSIEIRTKKIEIIDEAMDSDPLLRIKYSAKKVSISNAWKKWIGEIQGLERMQTIEKKQEYEARLTAYINADPGRKSKYGGILQRYSDLYAKLRDYSLANTYTNDAFFSNGAEAVALARNILPLILLIEEKADEESIRSAKESQLSYAVNFFKNFDNGTDMKLFVSVMELYGKTLDPVWQSPGYKAISEKCKNDFSTFAAKAYSASVFTDEERFNTFVNNLTASGVKKLQRDPFYLLARSTTQFISENVTGELSKINTEIQKLDQDYMRLQMEFETDQTFYPDANLTLRLSYGTVKGYYSKDAVWFRHYSTLKGIIEKDNPEIYDYDVPDRLKQLYLSKDYGRYTQDGEVPVCFIANNHTTGGNSGSPVINGDGHLIGINFDRAWEGVASDMAFNPDQSRNISLDIRYALFIIDKFAGAGYLLDEMTIME